MLTGRVLASAESPREHLNFDTDLLIGNLATCKEGNSSFRLNAEVFSASIRGAGPANIDALGNVNVAKWWMLSVQVPTCK